MPKPANTITDVFKHIDMGEDDDCWEWKGKTNAKDGRPYFTVEGKRRPSYAVALEAFTGEEQGDRYVLHQCDNPICCNPHHLRWGTHQENMNEMKDRERHGIPKTVQRAIKKLHSEGRTHKDIADLYGLDRSTITKFLNKEDNN